jgi:transcriptional regulator
LYVPRTFERTETGELLAFAAAHPFAVLVSDHNGEPFATHLPLLVERDTGALVGHMARANPHWTALDGKPVLAIFSGPHAYVSPTWYEAENVVPTWNYVAVHATGTFRLLAEPDAVRVLLDTVREYEGSGDGAWSPDAESAFFRGLVQGIVAFRVEVARWEGKWKLSQNQPPERRAKVRAALAASTDPAARAVARLMGEG